MVVTAAMFIKGDDEQHTIVPGFGLGHGLIDFLDELFSEADIRRRVLARGFGMFKLHPGWLDK